MGCYKVGISYAVVTKVKELTEDRRFGEALDLLEGEDIFQSLNPQFLRCCGEVYLETNRFYESREALVKAHIMAPEGNRIIFDLVHLYLKMGYFQRAKRYYDIYAYHAVSDDPGKLYLQYMIQKAQRTDAEKLLKILEKACEEQYSDEWGFELALLYASLGMQGKMKEECIHVMAAFRKSPYYSLAEALKRGEYEVGNSNFLFPIMEMPEDEEQYASIMTLEEPQLEKDELKVHPPEAMILQMEDDDAEPEPDKKQKGFGMRFPFVKKQEKDLFREQQNVGDIKTQDSCMENVDSESAEAVDKEGLSAEEITEEESKEETLSEVTDVSSYIESVMKSVENIEATVAEELNRSSGEKSLGEKNYQSKLHEVEENLSPKERLEQLMRLIEEEREEEKKQIIQEPKVDEELDLDEFLMNLVGSNTITQAMVKTYHEEKKAQDSGIKNKEDGKERRKEEYE